MRHIPGSVGCLDRNQVALVVLADQVVHGIVSFVPIALSVV
jgi:hypothetical protein